MIQPITEGGLGLNTATVNALFLIVTIDKAFEQFYRVEQSRSFQHGGSGIELSIVRRIVEIHGGKTKFESKQWAWTRVTICLPLSRDTASA